MNTSMCELCKHKLHPDGGWCYMFRHAPSGPCAQHSVVTLSARNIRLAYAEKILKAMK